MASTTQKIRKTKQLLKIQENKCYYCGCDFNNKINIPTIEHLKKRAEGGTFRNENIVVACYTCNQYRGSYPPHIWKVVCTTLIPIYKQKRLEKENCVKRYRRTHQSIKTLTTKQKFKIEYNNFLKHFLIPKINAKYDAMEIEVVQRLT
jgi:hypothetical protein